MFCIIQGRIQGYFGWTGLLPETLYWCGFWRFTIYIYILFSIHYRLQFHLPFAFFFLFRSVSFVFFLPFIQPVFFKRPSLCWKNSGWICIFWRFTGIIVTQYWLRCSIFGLFKPFFGNFPAKLRPKRAKSRVILGNPSFLTLSMFVEIPYLWIV